MTLVIAKKQKHSAFILSDTLVTSSSDRPDEHVLKTVILTPRVCVSFAGNTHFAEQAINSFGLNSDFRCTVDHFLRWHRESRSGNASETDFVLATAFSQRVKLLKVANGYVCPVSHAWIGSKQAYVRYEAYHDGRRTPLLRNSVSGLHLEVFGSDHSQGGDKAYAGMRRAFRETLNSADLQEIAGFVISATYVTGSYHHFSYMPCSEIITCPSHFAVGDIVFTNRDPSTSYFDFRIELMVARWPARPAVAIFFPDGECGYIYVASNHDRMPRRCTINNVENIEKFVLVSREAYGVFLPEVERVGVCDLLSGVAGGKKVFHTITPTGMGN